MLVYKDVMLKHPTRRAILTGLSLAAAAFPRLGWSQGLPTVVVAKDPTCGCCTGWVDHLRAAGFVVEVVETTALAEQKVRLGVPTDLAACHTAEVAGYTIEGHVPAGAIKRLLVQRPAARGLAVPGMPIGAPGMEVGGTEPQVYDVIAFSEDGRRSTYARYRGASEI